MGIIEQPFVQLSIPVTTTQPTIEIALTCAYYQQVGHEFKNCPFVDDKLKRLMREELKTSLQPMVPNTPTTHVVEHVQQTHTQPSLVTNRILVSQHSDWLQLVTPLIARQPKIILYHMWYNTITSFVLMDFNMYSMYYSRIKGLNPLNFGRKKGCGADVIQPKPMLPIGQLVQN